MILLPGNSGCSVSLIQSNNFSIIRKSTDDPDYITRLRQQCEKQKQHQEIIEKSGAFVPDVITFFENGKNAYFDMEYIKSRDMITYFKTCSKEKIDNIASVLIKIISTYIDQSKNENIVKDFCAKTELVIHQIKENRTIDKKVMMKIEKKLRNIDEMILPVGFCHGDLTFSNVLMSNNEIHIIDMLDNFVETPIQDMVKIRQDTKYAWSLQKYVAKIDIIRLKIIFEYLDNKFHDFFSSFDFYKKHYNHFQILNIMRIYRYTKNKKTIDYLNSCLEGLI
mgnify:CR=1 FL=1|tara:strand:+ start:5992 stop:6828 length:837 start_codon:yes stop_codon:yes gene_type:complete